MDLQSQRVRIKEHLKAGKKLTALDALNLFGCLRLSGRIHELRHKYGLPINSEMIIRGGKRVAQYYMERDYERN